MKTNQPGFFFFFLSGQGEKLPVYSQPWMGDKPRAGLGANRQLQDSTLARLGQQQQRGFTQIQ